MPQRDSYIYTNTDQFALTVELQIIALKIPGEKGREKTVHAT